VIYEGQGEGWGDTVTGCWIVYSSDLILLPTLIPMSLSYVKS
jgi:hypothetical protein